MNYQRIYNFILMLVASHNNADDIMQETTLAMFEKFNSFEKGSDFLAWAKTIAKYKTLEFLKTQKKDKVVFRSPSKMCFSSAEVGSPTASHSLLRE
jgi:RNA polymerase sigma-70 factor (ECF subfamily)